MADAENNGQAAAGAGAGTGDAGTRDDAAFYQAEAKKAFKARDELKERLRKAEEAGLLISDDQATRYKELEAQAAKAEEDRKRKEGEFDSWRATIAKKHDEALQTERQRADAAAKELHQTLVGLAFAGATDYFGGESAKTILTPDIAEAYYGRFVEVQEHEGRKSVVVKDHDGNVILDAKTGKPASFAAAIGELIEASPNKDRILRGSGKTGSGSSGGAGGRDVIDLRNLTPDQRRDPKVLAALRASLPRGGVVMGEAYER